MDGKVCLRCKGKTLLAIVNKLFVIKSLLTTPGLSWHTQILADQLTLFQQGGTDYAHLITTGTPGFSDLPTALILASLFNIFVF